MALHSGPQGQSNSSSRRHSLDSQDLLMNSPPWLEEEKGASGADGRLSGPNHHGDRRQSPEVFYEKRNRDTYKVYPEQPLNKISAPRRHSLDNGLARTKYQTSATDDSDDLEAATSDSSEPDYQWQLNIHKSNSMPNVVGSKIRKPSPKPTKSQEMR